VIDARFSFPAALVSFTRRWSESPGTSPVAPMVRRLSAEPAAPRVMATVPEAIDCEALVELVKVAKVPRPAMPAVAPTAAREKRSFLVDPPSRRAVSLCISSCPFIR
jgi:hypothetical protein